MQNNDVNNTLLLTLKIMDKRSELVFEAIVINKTNLKSL